MKKRGVVGVYTFVRAAAVLIVLVAFLLITPKFSKLLFEAGEKGECQWNVLISALTRTPGLGFENIPVECKAKYMNVSTVDLQGNYISASDAIIRYHTGKDPVAYAPIYKYFPENSEDNPLKLAEWSLDKIVADEMVECWDKVWQGELALFSVWYKLIDFESAFKDIAKPPKPKSGEDAAKIYLIFWNMNVHRPPVSCIVCSRIKFNEDVKNMFAGNPKIKSLGAWMKFNPVSGTKESYYEYLMTDWMRANPLFRPKLFNYVVDEPLAVVYARINMHKAVTLSETVAAPVRRFLGLGGDEDLPDKADRVAVVPYSKVIAPFDQGGLNCDIILD